MRFLCEHRSDQVFGMRLNDSGSLLYVPYSQGINIFDIRHGDLRERIFLTEQMNNFYQSIHDLSNKMIHNMAIDETGKRIFLITSAGLTIATLDSVPLSIGSVNPMSAASGTQITIRGSGFVQSSNVSVNNTPATVTFVDANTLSVIVPFLPAGPAQITVNNPDGQIYSLDAAFSILGRASFLRTKLSVAARTFPTSAKHRPNIMAAGKTLDPKMKQVWTKKKTEHFSKKAKAKPTTIVAGEHPSKF